MTVVVAEPTLLAAVDLPSVATSILDIRIFGEQGLIQEPFWEAFGVPFILVKALSITWAMCHVPQHQLV